MHLLNFTKFIKENNLKGKDDETVTTALVKTLIH